MLKRATTTAPDRHRLSPIAYRLRPPIAHLKRRAPAWSSVLRPRRANYHTLRNFGAENSGTKRAQRDAAEREYQSRISSPVQYRTPSNLRMYS